MLVGDYFKDIDLKNKRHYFSGISFNSLKCKKKNIFFAIKGNKVDGNKFIDEAIANGASTIVSNKDFEGIKKNVLYIKTINPSSNGEDMENWIDQNTKMIILGDFNHSVIWDNKLPEQYTFKNLNDFMVNKGFKSIYHQTHEEKLGSESCPTFYHQKNANKPFHIDYGYIKGFNSYHLDVGNYSDWIKHSDHMPLIMNIKDTN